MQWLCEWRLHMKVTQTTDYELIARLNQPVQQIHFELKPDYFKEYNYDDVKQFFKDIVHKDGFIFLLLEEGVEPLGFAMIEIREYPENPFRRAYRSVFVHQISIVEAQRKKGYGTRLMEEIYNIAKKHGIDVIELDYWVGNTVAEKFYKKHGFIKQREFVYIKI